MTKARNRLLSLLLGLVLALALEGCLATSRNACRVKLAKKGPVAAGRENLRWKKRQIKVGFMDGNLNLKQRVLQAANEWRTVGGANVVFIEGNVDEANIRVSFQGSGYWSYLGTQALDFPKSEQTMNLQFPRNVSQKELRRVTLHEFGHALGLLHEHASPLSDINWDKEAVYKHYMRPPIAGFRRISICRFLPGRDLGRTL